MNIRRWLVPGLAAGSVLAAASAQAATLTVVNNSSSYVEVTVDGVHGCHTADHTKCTIPVAAGQHHLRAVRDDNGASQEGDAQIPESGFTLTLSDGG